MSGSERSGNVCADRDPSRYSTGTSTRRSPGTSPVNSRSVSVTTKFWMPLGEMGTRPSGAADASASCARNRASTAFLPRMPSESQRVAGPAAGTGSPRPAVLPSSRGRMTSTGSRPAATVPAAAIRTSAGHDGDQSRWSAPKSSASTDGPGTVTGVLGACGSLIASCSRRVASASNRAMSSRSPGSAFRLRAAAEVISAISARWAAVSGSPTIRACSALIRARSSTSAADARCPCRCPRVGPGTAGPRRRPRLTATARPPGRAPP